MGSGMGYCRILLVDNYDSYTWNLFQQLWKISGIQPVVVRNDETTAADLLRGGFTHLVISPGPGRPEREEDFGLCADLLDQATVPCLGVCLGHQGIGYLSGGTIGPAVRIIHGITSAIQHDGQGLFAGLPQGFRAVRYHSLAIQEPVPRSLSVTARAEDGTIMGIAHRERPLVGVQFHPESVETECGDHLIANFIALTDSQLSLPSRYCFLPRKREPRKETCFAQRLVPVSWQELDVELATEKLFTRVFARSPYAFWLDSSLQAYGMGRYSYLGAAEVDSCVVARGYAATSMVEEETARGICRIRGSIFDYLRIRLSEFPVACADSPWPFVGGFVGYIGYGTKASLGLGRACSGGPDAELLRVDRFVAVDHDTGRSYLVTVGMPEAEAQAWRRDIGIRARQAADAEDGPQLRAVLPPVRQVDASVDLRTYRRHFDKIQHWLREGESYEACYTYQIQATSTLDPLEAYLQLRTISPAPYAAYLRFRGRRVLSSSPERFVTVDAGRWAETKPIKGTARRHSDTALDKRASRALQTDDKTRSENLMIADLLRNDLGQVCEVGSVHVPQLMAVESYALVHQLVTTVRGRLRDGCDGVDCVEALFPGGSMTGAPKKRTIELLDELESVDRGIYAGCLGFFGFDGQADQSIIIRTMVWEGTQVSFGVGGAITVMSDVDDEYEETRLKAVAMMCALGTTEAPSVLPAARTSSGARVMR